MSDIRVLIADDHPVVREGLRGMLAAEPGIEVAGEASSGNEAVAQVRSQPFDVVLMDLRMPDGDGLSVIPSVIAERPGIRVIVLTTYESHADILQSVERGAVGYLLKDTTRLDLVAAIRSAHRGETVLAPSAVAKLATHVRTPAGGSISPRERDVLAQVAQGLTNAEIGKVLFISETTVKTHIMRIFTKLGVSDRTAAVTRAIEQGILPLG
jgi:DNA-binding NarL/FixJ family response regulator